jgi:Flp pilus assembly pilin Flp
MHSIMRLLRDSSGTADIQYGLFAAVIAVGVVAVLQLFGVIQPH